jgi:hypothetical protein
MTSHNPILSRESPGSVQFFGSASATLFSAQVNASLRGVLTRNMVTDPADPMVGFASASIDGRPWTGTMWTRDAGVFLRELAQWGYLEHACLLAQNLMRLVRPNPTGYDTFPEHFDLGKPGSGSELDGTGAIIIGLVLLWERLPAGHPVRSAIQQFLGGAQSPLQYTVNRLAQEPLIAGSGEFGAGCGVPGEVYNVVQNNLVRLALLAAARMAETNGDAARTEQYATLAAQLSTNMQRVLRADDDTWVWCVDTQTLRGDPAILDHFINKGFGGLNGVLAMSADVAGFDPDAWHWPGTQTGMHTFERLYAFPLRKAMFEKYGAWTQFDVYDKGYLTGPSYGHGYALQAMLLMDRLDMAGHALDFLAQATHTPQRGNVLTRDCDDYFYERYYLPELSDFTEAEVLADQPGFNTFVDGHLDEGCGALNLVCVAEPLKVARLVVGLDDSDPAQTRLIPRLPPEWTGYIAHDWPIYTASGLVRADIRIERRDQTISLGLRTLAGQRIPHLAVRAPASGGQWRWQHMADISQLDITV